MPDSAGLAASIDTRRLRDVCGRFGTGVTVLATRCDGCDHGMTANAFMSVSLDPPLIAVAVAETARMLPRLRRAGRFAVSVLADTMDRVAWHFAGRPDPGFADLFDDLNGLPVVRGAAAALAADVEQEVAAGDHAVFIGRVRSLAAGDQRPLLFFRGEFAKLAAAEPGPPGFLESDRELIW